MTSLDTTKLLPVRSPAVPKDHFQIVSKAYPASRTTDGRKDKLKFVRVFDPEVHRDNPDKKIIILIPDIITDMAVLGLIFKKSETEWHDHYQGHVWEPEEIAPASSTSSSMPPEEGWGDPDNIQESLPHAKAAKDFYEKTEHPPVSYSAVPPKTKSSIQDCYTKTNGMIIFKAQDPKCITRLAEYFQIDPTLMHNIAQLTNAQNVAQFSLGVKDAPRAMDAQKIVVTAYIRSGQTSGGLPIDQDLVEAIS